MRTSTAFAASTLLSAWQAAAFPALKSHVYESRQATPPQGAGALPLVPPPFDPAQQAVSTTGQYAFVAPGASDARGECPGLNALANHGYIPHNGYATIAQFIDGTYRGVGMAADLAGFLAVYGSIIDGDGSSWSINGAPHTGIGGSHHNYEADSSPFKSDLDQYGSLERLIIPQFEELYNMQPADDTANYNLEVMRTFRGKRFQESVSMNPYFFYGPFDGVEVSQAAFTFIYRFMSNKSAEAPEGILNRDNLKSWMSISGPDDNLVWTPGHERIPSNFYKRHPTDSYSIPYFEADILYFAETVPQVFDVGCNTGKVNSYQTADIFALTFGVLAPETLTSSPFCYSMNFLEAGAESMYNLSATQTAQLMPAIQSAAAANNCPPNLLKTPPNLSIFSDCPGASFYGGPTGPVAPGAIQAPGS